MAGENKLLVRALFEARRNIDPIAQAMPTIANPTAPGKVKTTETKPQPTQTS